LEEAVTWRIDDPQGNEAAKVRYDVVPFTRGVVLDLGCGPFKAFPHFIGVDNGHHAREFGWQFRPDVTVASCELLAGNMTPAVAKRLGIDALDLVGELEPDIGQGMIPDASCDAVFSSHLLEHIENTQAALAEWWRVIKPGGHLALYLPDEDQYPRVGEAGANPDHKWNLNRDLVMSWMEPIGSWDLRVNERRDARYEYSFLQVFQKLVA
jgi:SAM-dependent methyltransferase